MHRPASFALVAVALSTFAIPVLADESFHPPSIKGWFAAHIPFGDVNHKYVVKPPSVNDARIGKSHGFPAALKIVVDESSTGFPGGIGKIVHDALFATYPKLTFKVAFACANTNLLGHGDYANPKSIWYNVFFGYYEIDVPKAAWKRPFGYEADGKKIHFEDLVRIGKADWNHFSNQLYGVPESAIAPLDVVNMSEVRMEPVVRQKVGQRLWDLVFLHNVRVVGPYRSNSDGGKFADLDKLVGPAWRHTFGKYDKDVPGAKSFAPTSMTGKFYISFTESTDAVTHEPIYRTFMFGGTVNEQYPNKAENDRFLALQMKSLAVIIASERGLGFAH